MQDTTVSYMGTNAATNTSSFNVSVGSSVPAPSGIPAANVIQGPPGPKGDPFLFEDFTREQLESLRGPRGEHGLMGLQGPPGEPGHGLNILGVINSKKELPMFAEEGDIWLVENDLYLFVGYSRGDECTPNWAWKNLGPANQRGPQGERGEKGDPLRFEDLTEENKAELRGEKGEKGDSAYDIAVKQGFVGSVEEWRASLKGEKGDAGIQGIQGLPGERGEPGLPGKSAYDLWLEVGNRGTLTDFLNSLKGDKGDTGEQGDVGPQGPEGDRGDTGPQGNPFRIKTSFPSVTAMQEQLNTERFEYGDVVILSALAGEDAGKIYIKTGGPGQLTNWDFIATLTQTLPSIPINNTGTGVINGRDGAPGKSAYEIAKENRLTTASNEVEWVKELMKKSEPVQPIIIKELSVGSPNVSRSVSGDSLILDYEHRLGRIPTVKMVSDSGEELEVNVIHDMSQGFSPNRVKVTWSTLVDPGTIYIY